MYHYWREGAQMRTWTCIAAFLLHVVHVVHVVHVLYSTPTQFPPKGEALVINSITQFSKKGRALTWR